MAMERSGGGPNTSKWGHHRRGRSRERYAGLLGEKALGAGIGPLLRILRTKQGFSVRGNFSSQQRGLPG